MKKARKIILISLICFLLIGIVTYSFKSINSKKVETEYATYMSVTDSIQTDCFVVRDETYITNNSDGVLSFEVADGTKVSANGVVAKLYNNETDAVTQQKIDELNAEIKQLEDINKSNLLISASLDAVNSQINLKIFDFINNINLCNYNNIDTTTNNLLSIINQRQIITGKEKNFDEKIKSLKNEKASLKEKSGSYIGEIKAKKAGYFISQTDGYEKSYDYSKIKDITLDEYKKLTTSGKAPNNTIGKIYSELNWYLVCPVTAREALSLAQGSGSVVIDLPFASAKSLPAKVAAINQKTKQDDGVVVLQCNYVTESIVAIRKENIDINIAKYNGLRISKKALHDDYVTYEEKQSDGSYQTKTKLVQGVYIVYGTQIVFRQVDVLYAGNDYVICNDNSNADEILNHKTVTLYDQVVVGGSDLKDGKIIS